MKSSNKDSKSTMRFFPPVVSKAKKLFAPSATKEKAQNGEKIPVDGFDIQTKPAEPGFGYKNPDFGSREESFFDSRAWLDSDCEDDFLSVNGEFTPSRGSTPNHQTSILVAPQLNKAYFAENFPDSKSEPSPSGRRKLADLLQEAFPSEKVGDKHNVVDGMAEVNGKSDVNKTQTDQRANSVSGTPYLSGSNSICSSERTPNIDAKNGKEKSEKVTLCCLPSFVLSLRFTGRKKQRLSPG